MNKEIVKQPSLNYTPVKKSTMRCVEITKCSNDDAWYSAHIGSFFVVREDFDEDNKWLAYDNGKTILKKDARMYPLNQYRKDLERDLYATLDAL